MSTDQSASTESAGTESVHAGSIDTESIDYRGFSDLPQVDQNARPPAQRRPQSTSPTAARQAAAGRARRAT